MVGEDTTDTEAPYRASLPEHVPEDAGVFAGAQEELGMFAAGPLCFPLPARA